MKHTCMRLFLWLAACGTAIASEIPNGFLVGPDGKRFFPIGLYAFPQDRKDDSIYREAHAAGFNFLVGHEAKMGFVRSYDIPAGPPDPDAKDRRGSLLDLAKQEALKGGLLELMVAQQEGTAGVVAWQGPDEPNDFPFGIRPGPTPQGLAKGKQFLRDRSKHPLWINFGPTGDDRHPEDFERLRPYLAIPDIVSVDIYPIGGGADLQQSPFAERGPACVGVITRNLVRMVSRDGVQQKPVWMVLQAFGWGDLARASNPPEPWTGRHPSSTELRFMTFDAIISGAGGVIYWGLPYLPKDDPMWESLKSVATELHELLPVLMADSRRADHVVQPSNPAIEVAIRGTGGGSTLLMANSTSAAQETTLSFHGIKVGRLKPIGRTGATATEGTTFRIRLEPLEVAVFQLEE